MGSVAQLHDPIGDELIARAERVGGAENLSEAERWSYRNTLDARQRHAAKAAQRDGRTDALDAQRLAAIEARLAWLKWMLEEGVGQVIGESIGEAERCSSAETKTLLAELRDEANAKIDAAYSGFEHATGELRHQDRSEIIATLRETLVDAEARIDARLEKALQSTWERAELEIALVRDECLNVIAEKSYGQLTDDTPKLELAEKAIAKLRRDLKATSGKHDAMAERIVALENKLTARVAGIADNHRGAIEKLITRTGASIVAARSADKRTAELGNRVAAIEETLSRLWGTLIEQKIIT